MKKLILEACGHHSIQFQTQFFLLKNREIINHKKGRHNNSVIASIYIKKIIILLSCLVIYFLFN